jgi:excisionase family DNA binding protein
MQSRWPSVDKLAESLRVGKGTADIWVTSKSVPKHMTSRLWMFKKDRINAWIRAAVLMQTPAICEEGGGDA